MWVLMLCVCLGLTSALEENNLGQGLTNQFLLNSEATKISANENSLPIQLVPITIPTRISPDLLIPSVPASNNVGNIQGIPENPNLNIKYSTEPIYVSSFGNEFSSGAGLGVSSIGSEFAPIPVQVGTSTDFKSLNLDSSLSDRLTTFEVKPIENINPIVNFVPGKENGNSFSIKQAVDVAKFEFSGNDDFKVGTDRPVVVGNFNSLDNSEESTKSVNNKPSSKVSYSIEKVPEVASFHKTGPLVPSDIPSISELLKIFSTKSVSEETPDTKIETTTTNTEDSDDDDTYLDLIEERISSRNRKVTNGTVLSLASRITGTTSNSLEQEDKKTPSNITTNNILVREDINVIESNKFSNATTIEDVEDEDNGPFKFSNEKQESKQGNSTSDVQARISEDEDTTLENTNSTSLNDNVSEDSIQIEIPNETPSKQLTKLNASSSLNENDDVTGSETFSNATTATSNDLFKSSNESQIGTSGNSTVGVGSRISEVEDTTSENTNTTNVNDSVSENNIQIDTSKQSTKLNASSFINANDILKESLAFTAINDSAEPSILLEQPKTEIVSNSTNSLENITLKTTISTSDSIPESLSLITDNVFQNNFLPVKSTNESHDNVKTTESSLVQIRIAEDSLNLPIDVSSETESTIDSETKSNQTETQSNVAGTENLAGSLVSTVAKSNTSIICGCNRNKTDNTESESLNTPVSLSNESEIRSRFSESSDLNETTNSVGNNSVTFRHSLENETDSGDIENLIQARFSESTTGSHSENITLTVKETPEEEITTVTETDLVIATEISNDNVTESAESTTTSISETTTLEEESSSLII